MPRVSEAARAAWADIAGSTGLGNPRMGQGRIQAAIDAEKSAVVVPLACEIADLQERLEGMRKTTAALHAKIAELVEALREIAGEPCDHGPAPFCPREKARALLSRYQSEKV